MNLPKLLLILTILTLVFIYYSVNVNMNMLFFSFTGIVCTAITIVANAHRLTGVED